MTVSLRKYPYPYQAMLAICSDLDETPNKEIYFETARYLNTTEETLLGKGVGLEVGNTIYFDMPAHNFSYTNSDDDGRRKVQQLIQSGHIDCLHSFGDFVTSREQINKYWSSIRQGERKIEVWVDHAQAATNLDNDIMQGQGAEIGKSAYHADLTVQSGALPFIWKGRVTSCVAQNSKRSYASIFNRKQFKASSKTILLEFIKGWLARLGNKKYAMHKANKVLRKTTLIDGTPVLEFMRCNPSWGGVSMFDTARGIHNVLTPSVLNTLVTNQGCSIFYSHLGKVNSVTEPFTCETRQAFELLASYQHKQQILVTTTRRLLGYNRSVDELDFVVKQQRDETQIHLTTAYSGEDLNGLTWYVEEPEKVRLFINEKEYFFLQNNPVDETGKLSVSIAWVFLLFPCLNLDRN
ncbi:MAG: hypothetical protein ACJAT7_000694 [Psychromonas sp.]|jgi:hypothetical protein|uniref:hypothetical protein n=1 Tax=Psychromonas sp. TaxID=1884585 RepID=UPI0039E2F033